MKKLILTTADSDTLRQHATDEDKMLTLQEDGINKIFKGITTIEEVYRVCHT